MRTLYRHLACCMFVVTCAFAAHAHEQYLPTPIGDYVLAAVNEYALAFDAFEMDLPMVNHPMTNGDYSVECRVLFVDGKNLLRRTKGDVNRYLAASDVLNDLVKKYFTLKYEGLEYEVFLSKYLAGDIRHDLNGDPVFLVWLRQQIESLEEGVYRPDVNMIKVQIEAKGDFRLNLIERFRASLPDDE